MNTFIAWPIVGVASVVIVVLVMMLLKKNRELQQMTEDVSVLKQDRDEKNAALEKLKQEFDDKLDDVVQSSIQKISHAEQAREEAVQAAQDNYEAAAEVHALLKEKEELINKLQSEASQHG